MSSPPFILLVILFSFSSSLAAQDTLVQVFLWKSTREADGVSANQAIHLSGEAAQQFNWAEQFDDYSAIIIHRVLPSKAPQASKNIDEFKTMAWNTMKRVVAIHETRDQQSGLIYKHYGEYFPDDEERYFSTAQKTTLPDLYVGRSAYDRVALDLALIWMESGECPGEWGEYEQQPGEIELLFTDKKKQVLMKRNISSQLISHHGDQITRVVEIEVELPPHQ